jgi:hypothetical protein
MADNGIKVTVINPGYTKTNLSVNSVTGSGKISGGKNFMNAILHLVCLELKVNQSCKFINILKLIYDIFSKIELDIQGCPLFGSHPKTLFLFIFF